MNRQEVLEVVARIREIGEKCQHEKVRGKDEREQAIHQSCDIGWVSACMAMEAEINELWTPEA